MSNRRMTTTHCAQMAVVRAFISDHGTALLNASRLLGSTPGCARSQALLEEIRQGRKVTRRMRQRLVDLHALLTLQNVGDPDRIETACFAAIDPASPVVEEICLLADALYDMLTAISQEKTGHVADIDTSDAPHYQDAA